MTTRPTPLDQPSSRADPLAGAAGAHLSLLRPVIHWLGLAIVFLLPIMGAAAPTAKFDLPAGDAGRSLKMFSVQSGLEVIFPTGVVRGVRVQALKGEFTPRDAMTKLLNGTGLAATYDQKNGTVTVMRESPNGRHPGPPTASEHSLGKKKVSMISRP